MEKPRTALSFSHRIYPARRARRGAKIRRVVAEGRNSPITFGPSVYGAGPERRKRPSTASTRVSTPVNRFSTTMPTAT